MSETDDSVPDMPVSMTKQTKQTVPTGAGRKAAIPDVPLPTTMKAAFVALIVVLIGSLARGVAVGLSSANRFTAYEIHTNNHQKTPKKPYTAHQISDDIHALRSSYVVYAVLTALIVAFLIWGLRKARSASASRWVLIFALFFTGALGGAVPPYGFPGLVQGLGVVVAVAALIAIVLVFTKPSMAYARTCRELSIPPERRGQPRPKLFGARTAPAPRQGAAARAAASRPAAPRPASTGGGKSKAKARSDADAVARGAELARTRARASKSRRTDV